MQSKSRFVLLVAAMAFVSIAGVSLFLDRNSENEESESSGADKSTSSVAEIDVPAHKATANQTNHAQTRDQPFNVVSDFDIPLDDQSRKWLDENFFKNPSAVKYDEYRLAKVDTAQLLLWISSSPQYLSAVANATYSGDVFPEFLFSPFEKKNYRLVIQRALVLRTNDGTVTAVSGVSYDDEENLGQWSLVINEEDHHISGHIDSADEWIKFWPAPTQKFHVFAQLSQENRRNQLREKSDW